MSKVIKILWIEDNAAHDLAYWAAPVYVAGGYDLSISFNASEGLTRLQEQEFDGVIVDVRIPPGASHEWIDVYQEAAKAGVEPQLGLQLIYTVLGRDDEVHTRLRSCLTKRPQWIKPKHLAVLTVERRDQEEIQKCLDSIGISIFFEKRTDTPETILLDIIKTITARLP